ncbi:hypothetical protein ACLB1G_10530 [Oxalobacteraceae bacterium A2-2]
MTMPVPFDTHAYIHTLIQAGFPPDQAEAHAQALIDALVSATVTPGEHIVLKVELLARMDGLRNELLARMDMLRDEMLGRMDMLRTELLARIEKLEADLTARITKLEGRVNILYWLAGATLLLQGVTLALVLRLPG